jgi:hypothetical protein
MATAPDRSAASNGSVNAAANAAVNPALRTMLLRQSLIAGLSSLPGRITGPEDLPFIVASVMLRLRYGIMTLLRKRKKSEKTVDSSQSSKRTPSASALDLNTCAFNQLR